MIQHGISKTWKGREKETFDLRRDAYIQAGGIRRIPENHFAENIAGHEMIHFLHN